MKTLLVLLGPTGVGKTESSIRIAEALNAPILSADSRQLYRGMEIGTAAPADEQLARVAHYFIGTLQPEDYYSASLFEEQAISLITKLHDTYKTVVLTGGSMMYIDAVCKGIDEMPTVDEKLRNEVFDLYQREGIEPIRRQLKMLDPDFYRQVDLKNPKRVIHALEICLMTGKPYSLLRKNKVKKRPFKIVKIGFTRPREELYARIDARVNQMVKDGLVEEARRLYPQKHLNSLNTVGYKELFLYFDGTCPLEFAIDKIKQHSRNYARKQLSWFRRDKEIRWIDLSEKSVNILEEIEQILH